MYGTADSITTASKLTSDSLVTSLARKEASHQIPADPR
jgi:hypothetical protein